MTRAPATLHPIAQATPNVGDVVDMRQRQGHISGVVPRQLLTHPLWMHPKTASCAGSLHRAWWDPVELESGVTRWKRHTEIINPLAKDDRGTCSPHGLLRFLDLDVVMALSHAWLIQGEHIEIAQADLLRWMGHHDLLIAPYDELHASLERLQATNICLWDGDEKPRGAKIFRVVESATFVDGPRGTKIIEARLSPYWLDSLRSGRWQEVDLDAYAHLTRSYRRFGLARVIYCFLTACRTAELDNFRVLKDAVVQRYAPRKPDGKSLRYADHGNPNSALVKAMSVLRESGVLEISNDVPQTHIAGRFSTKGIPRLSDQFRQTRFCTADLWGRGQSPTTVALPLSPPADDPVPVPPPAPRLTAPTAKDRTIADPVHASCALLNREIRCNGTTIKKAKERGWQPHQFLHLMAEVHHAHRLGKVTKPGALMAKLLTEHHPKEYEDPQEPMWEWLRTTGYPDLPVFAVK